MDFSKKLQYLDVPSTSVLYLGSQDIIWHNYRLCFNILIDGSDKIDNIIAKLAIIDFKLLVVIKTKTHENWYYLANIISTGTCITFLQTGCNKNDLGYYFSDINSEGYSCYKKTKILVSNWQLLNITITRSMPKLKELCLLAVERCLLIWKSPG